MNGIQAKNNRKLGLITCIMMLFVLFIIGTVIYLNKEKLFTEKTEKVGDIPQVVEVTGSNKTVKTFEPYVEPSKKPETSKYDDSYDCDEAKDGLHTRVVLKDGTVSWQLITALVPVNGIKSSDINVKDGKVQYLKDGKDISETGIFINEDYKYIDFSKVKKSNIDFLMIKMGSSGYISGQVQLDDYFIEYCEEAELKGIPFGAYFESHAMTTEEAGEEAEDLINELSYFTVKYPVAIRLGYVDGVTTRDEILNREERTQVVKAFLNKVKDAGYIPAIYANKEWLVVKLNLNQLTDFEIILEDQNEMFDYPYYMQMWDYGECEVSGIKGTVERVCRFNQ